MTIVKPVVILDGLLAFASLDVDGAMHIGETDGVALRFQFRTAKYGRDHYRIDVVTLDSLGGYLELCEKRTESFLNALASIALSRRGEG